MNDEERIDHAKLAMHMLDTADGRECNLPEQANWLLDGQIHATLALVEQQRIANLITLSGWVDESSAEDVGYVLDKLRVGIAGEVWAGLGLLS